VLIKEKNLVGMSPRYCHRTRAADLKEVGEAIAEISEPSRPHK
jgi:hypothetical protein